MRFVLLVGEAPGRADQLIKYDPLVGRCSKFIAQVANIDHTALLSMTIRVNLFNHLVRGLWDKDIARAQYRKLMDCQSDLKAVILLGRRVQVARDPHWMGPQCGFGGITTTKTGPVKVYYVPHPSGRCRFWNNVDNRRAASKVLRTALLEGV